MDLERYKTIFLDYTNHKKSALNLELRGDDLARELERTLNDQYNIGYELEKIIEPSSIGTASHKMYGYILLFKRMEE